MPSNLLSELHKKAKPYFDIKLQHIAFEQILGIGISHLCKVWTIRWRVCDGRKII